MEIEDKSVEALIAAVLDDKMELYYDGECFIYTNGQSKFIVHPNYKPRTK